MTYDPSAEPAEEESAVAKVLARFPETVKAAMTEYEPSIITRYALELCAAFNRFYHNCQILSAENTAVKNNRIALTACARSVLGKALHLVCMATPEKI